MAFMILIKFSDNPSPVAYFFSDAPTANRFYYMKKEFYQDDDYLKDTKISLWRLSNRGNTYELRLSNY